MLYGQTKTARLESRALFLYCNIFRKKIHFAVFFHSYAQFYEGLNRGRHPLFTIIHKLTFDLQLKVRRIQFLEFSFGDIVHYAILGNIAMPSPASTQCLIDATLDSSIVELSFAPCFFNRENIFVL